MKKSRKTSRIVGAPIGLTNQELRSRCTADGFFPSSRMEAALLLALAAAIALQAACFHLRAETEAENGGGGGAGGGSDAGVSSMGGSSSGSDIILDGGLSDAITAPKMACGDSTEQLSHTPAVGLDISNATGYRPDSTVKSKVTSIVSTMNKTQLANQMRGPPATSGGQAQDRKSVV